MLTHDGSEMGVAVNLLRAQVELDAMLGAPACARSAGSKHAGRRQRIKRQALDTLAQKLAECRAGMTDHDFVADLHRLTKRGERFQKESDDGDVQSG